MLSRLSETSWNALLVGWNLPLTWRRQFSQSAPRHERDALWFDIKLTLDSDPLLGGEEFYVNLYLRNNFEFSLEMKSPSGPIPRQLFTMLDRIEDLQQLGMTLQEIGRKQFCLGILGNETELQYELIAEWKGVPIRRYKGRLFSLKCSRIFQGALAKRGHRKAVRCRRCEQLRVKLKNADLYERKKISNRVKESYLKLIVPTEEEKGMIEEAEQWVSNNQATVKQQMPLLTYGSSELFTEAMQLASADSEHKQRAYSEGYLHFAAMVRELLGSSKYQSFRGFNIFPLPCIRTIDRWFAPTHYPVVVDSEILEQLDRAWKDFVAVTPQAARFGHLVSLSIDEIDLKRGLMWRGHRLIGEVRTRDGTQPLISLENPLSQLAPSGMLFVLRSCVFDQFRFPLCIFGVEGHPVGSSIAAHWTSVINPLLSAGYTVQNISSDGVRGSKEARLTIQNRFGITSYPDPGHVLKSLWKVLLKTSRLTTLWTPFGDASVAVLHACLAKSNSFLSVGARISECCLNPTASQKMSVRLPLQVFSSRMIAILETVEDVYSPGTLFYLKLVQGWWSVIADRRVQSETQWRLKRTVLEQISLIFRDWMGKASLIRELKAKNHTNRELSDLPDDSELLSSILPKPELLATVIPT